MATARIDWTAALAPGARIIPVVLIAGVPVVLTPAGVRPTSVAAPAGAYVVDSLWWPGTGTLQETLPGDPQTTFDPVEDLLDPTETWEVFESASLLKGDVRVEALTFSVLDEGGRGTALLSMREARPTQLLMADTSATDTNLLLSSVNNFPASGIACVGRETVTYASTDSLTTLQSCTRGKYGSRARVHASPAEHRPLVSAGGPRHWQGRLATVWLCVLSADGVTLTAPTLWFQGSVGAGVQMKGGLTRWSVPLDPITETLSRKITGPAIDLYGFAHMAYDVGHPLHIKSYQYLPLPDAEAGSLFHYEAHPHNAGWHPDLDSFLIDADKQVDTASTGKIHVHNRATSVAVTVQATEEAPCDLFVESAFDDRRWDTQHAEELTTWTSASKPEACFHLEGWCHLPTGLDFAKIPSTYSWTSDTNRASARLALVCDTDDTDGLLAEIADRDVDLQRVRLEAAIPSRTSLDVRALYKAARCTTRTAATLGVIARGPTPVEALQAASLAIDALTGQDLYVEAVDWFDLTRAMDEAPSALPAAREYRFGNGDDSFLAILIDELRLRGMCMTVRYGRISGARLQTFADVENTTATIVETDLLREKDGTETLLEVIDASEPLATRVVFELPEVGGKPRTATIADTTWRDEFGDGEEVKCAALSRTPPGALDGPVLDVLVSVAQQLLGPLAEPSRTIRMAVTPTLMGLQPGQLVLFTHDRIPTWMGTLGVSEQVCQVQEVRRKLFGGKLEVTPALRLQSGVRSGYAPAALVAEGGLSDASTTVTLDAESEWGTCCFTADRDTEGAPFGFGSPPDLLDGFSVGDVVVLSQIGDRTPIADEQRTLVSIDRALRTVVLSAAPSTAMADAAAGQYGVVLRFAGYAAATADQKLRWGWIADQTVPDLGSGDDPKRWAA